MDLGGATTGQPSTFGVLKVKQESESECPAELEIPTHVKQEAETVIRTGPDLLMRDEIEPFLKSELENDTMEFEDIKPGVAISEVFTMRVNSVQTSSRNSEGQPNFRTEPKTPMTRITKDNLRLHMNINKGIKLFTCKVCNYRTWKKLNFTVHKASHSAKKKRIYRRRGSRAKNHSAEEKQMQTHEERKRHKATQNLKEKPFECTECDFRASHIDLLNAHERKHTREKPFVCRICGYRSSWIQNLKKHMNIHTRNLPKKPIDSSRQGSLTNDNSAMEKQMEDHSEWKPHMTNRIIKEKPFKCLECDYQSIHKDLLDAHKRKHTGEKPFVCKICSYRSSWKGNLKKHMSVHTEEKLFAESHQDNQANNGSCMETRTEIKSKINEQDVPEMSYICEVCGYQTSWKRTLTKHMATHKPLICDVSGHKIIQQEADLNKHKIQDEPFACDLCNYKSWYRWNLKLHKNKNHHTQLIHLPIDPHSGQTIQPIYEEMDQLIELSHEDKGNQASENSTLDEHPQFYTEDKPFACDLCDYKSKYKWNVKLHKKKNHIQPVDSPTERQPIQPLQKSEKPYKGDHCDYIASLKHLPLAHERFRTGEKPFKCNSCGYRTAWKGKLRKHMNTCYSEDGECEYKTNYEPSLTAHKGNHARDKESAVGNQGNQAKNNSTFDEHTLSYEEDEPFACDLCDYKSKYKWNLKLHKDKKHHTQPVHSIIEPNLDQPIQPLHEEMDQLIELSHENNGNQASKNSTLDEHTQFHTKDKPFACDLCDYKSKYKWNLKLHKNKHHFQPVHDKVDRPIGSTDKNIKCAAGTSKHQPCSVCFKTESLVYKFRCESCRLFWNYWMQMASKPPDCPGHETEGEAVDCPGCRWERYKVAHLEWEKSHTKIKNTEDLDLDDFEPTESVGKMERDGSSQRMIECINGPIEPQLDHPIQPRREEMDQLIKPVHEDNTQFHTENKPSEYDYKSRYNGNQNKHSSRQCLVCFKCDSKVFKSRCKTCRAFWSYWKSAFKPPDCPGHTVEGEDVDCSGCRWGRYKMILLAEESQTTVKNPEQAKDLIAPAPDRMGKYGSRQGRINCTKGTVESSLDQPIQLLQDETDIKIEPVSEPPHDVAHPCKTSNHPICPICFKSESKVFKFRCEKCRWFWARMVKGLVKPHECPGHGSAGEDVDCLGCRRRRYEIAHLSVYPGEPLRVPPMTQPGQQLMDCLTAVSSNGPSEDGISIKEEAILNAYPGEPLRVPPMTKPGQQLIDYLNAGSSNAAFEDGVSIKEEALECLPW